MPVESMSTMASVTKQFTFDAAHRLPNHNGKCRNLHGHTYKVEVTCTGPINTDAEHPGYGMVVDFDVLKVAWGRVEVALDHRTLLWRDDPLYAVLREHHFQGIGIVFDTPPTAENIADFIMRQMTAALENIVVTRIRVWETATSYADVTN
jgi:6-pyruvoyltetrahydropterin/6-carboxytetrahydropterin synthase